jgi:hypothetical protein
MFGLIMAFATTFFIPSHIEPIVWLIIFVYCAYTIAKLCTGSYFLNGFMVSIFNCFWITSVHIIFSNTYLADHPQEVAMMANMPIPDSPRLMMLLAGPLVGIVSGMVLGLFTFIASKLVKNK